MLNGIDVSHWDEMPLLDGIDFVIIKATQGKNFIDPKMKMHASSALQNGKLIGFYHFANEDNDPEGNAKFFTSAVKDYLGKCILCLDWERESSSNDATRQGADYVLRWCSEVERITGVLPLVYMSKSVTYEYDFGNVVNGGYKLWVAKYPPVEHPTFTMAESWGIPYVGNWGKPTIWQFCSDGYVNNSPSLYDLDVFYGNKKDFTDMMSVNGVYSESEWSTVWENGEMRLQMKAGA